VGEEGKREKGKEVKSETLDFDSVLFHASLSSRLTALSFALLLTFHRFPFYPFSPQRKEPPDSNPSGSQPLKLLRRKRFIRQ
jgi:hypothetical protein